VLGIIDANDLGITLPHEHLLITELGQFVEPTEATQKRLAHQPITLENLNWVNLHRNDNIDNISLMD